MEADEAMLVVVMTTRKRQRKMLECRTEQTRDYIGEFFQEEKVQDQKHCLPESKEAFLQAY